MKNITISRSVSIRQAMKQLDKTAEKCLIVIDEKKILLGTLTDGDIRRSILSGVDVSASIETCYYTSPTVLRHLEYTRDEALNIMREKKLNLIPIVSNDNSIVDFVTWSNLGESNEHQEKILKNVSVVIMAGGKGTRMEPFTTILPKPLIPIHDKPIIEHIIEKFLPLGCKDFFLTVNYKSRILKAYFEDLNPSYSIEFIDEPKPLGTAGSLKFLFGKVDGPFFVTNCDVLVKTNYSSLYEFHNKGEYDLTLVASAKEYVIPYGTCELNGEGHLSHINEKPKYEFLINTGLYVLNPQILEYIPTDKYYHITQLIQDLKKAGKKIGVYPVGEDDWIDIGQWAEYKQAVGKL
jgi:dTDP-glucose pyrophosphorylase